MNTQQTTPPETPTAQPMDLPTNQTVRMGRVQKIARAFGIIIVLFVVLVVADVLLKPKRIPVDIETEVSCEESRYITITNISDSQEAVLKKWELYDSAGKHILPDMVILPQQSMRVWRGTGTNDAHNIYMGQGKETWSVKNGGSLRVSSPPCAIPFFCYIQIYFLSCTWDPAPLPITPNS